VNSSTLFNDLTYKGEPMQASNITLNHAQKKNGTILRILDVIDTISDWAGKGIGLLVIPMLILTLFLILDRSVFKSIVQLVAPGQFYNPDEEELPFFTTFIIMYFTLGAGYTLHHDGFIYFDVLYNRFSPRVKAFLNVCTYTLFFLTFGILLYGAWGDIIVLFEEGEEAAFGAQTELTQLQGYTNAWIYYSWFIGIILLLLEGVSRFLRNILILLGGGAKNG
jgi:TRAP-type mannitol/chloroaromatic compound transport system permease small subunit